MSGVCPLVLWAVPKLPLGMAPTGSDRRGRGPETPGESLPGWRGKGSQREVTSETGKAVSGKEGPGRQG